MRHWTAYVVIRSIYGHVWLVRLTLRSLSCFDVVQALEDNFEFVCIPLVHPRFGVIAKVATKQSLNGCRVCGQVSSRRHWGF
jgi:hypothetical protein